MILWLLLRALITVTKPVHIWL